MDVDREDMKLAVIEQDRWRMMIQIQLFTITVNKK